MLGRKWYHQHLCSLRGVYVTSVAIALLYIMLILFNYDSIELLQRTEIFQ